MNLKRMYELVLASESPRRRELLTNAGFKFQVHPSKISETLKENLTIDEQILDIAIMKARASVQSLPPTKANANLQSRLVLAADTMVVLDQRPLGKPASAADAVFTLRRMSGRAHWVKTSVCLIDENQKICESWIETTEVAFHSLSDQDIETYVNSGEPMDKAGSYGIQGRGGDFVAHISGSYTNVVGLPMESVVEKLATLFKLFPTHTPRALPQWQQRSRIQR